MYGISYLIILEMLIFPQTFLNVKSDNTLVHALESLLLRHACGIKIDDWVELAGVAFHRASFC